MQKVLSAASTASIFLPWVQISLFMSTTSMNLLSLILSWDIRSHILMCLGGVLFIAGSLALFIWKKAPLLQVAGLILVPLGFMTLAVDASAGTVSYGEAFQALQMFTGVGVYAGWAAAICGVMFMLLGWPTPRFLQGASIFPPRGLRGGEASVPAVHCRPAPLVPVRAALPPMSFPAAIEMAERHLAGGDLNAALTWYGRALGISRDDEERAISKVRIASVLNSWEKNGRPRCLSMRPSRSTRRTFRGGPCPCRTPPGRWRRGRGKLNRTNAENRHKCPPSPNRLVHGRRAPVLPTLTQAGGLLSCVGVVSQS